MASNEKVSRWCTILSDVCAHVSEERRAVLAKVASLTSFCVACAHITCRQVLVRNDFFELAQVQGAVGLDAWCDTAGLSEPELKFLEGAILGSAALHAPSPCSASPMM